MTTKQLNKRTKDFPPEGTTTLLTHGFNFYYGNKTYSFYYTTKNPHLGKMVVNSKVFHFHTGEELKTLQLVIEKKEVKPQPEPEQLTVNKAQQCIDHLIKKKELVLASKRTDNTRLLNMLTHLIDELKQYL